MRALADEYGDRVVAAEAVAAEADQRRAAMERACVSAEHGRDGMAAELGKAVAIREDSARCGDPDPDHDPTSTTSSTACTGAPCLGLQVASVLLSIFHGRHAVCIHFPDSVCWLAVHVMRWQPRETLARDVRTCRRCTALEADLCAVNQRAAAADSALSDCRLELAAAEQRQAQLIAAHRRQAADLSDERDRALVLQEEVKSGSHASQVKELARTGVTYCYGWRTGVRVFQKVVTFKTNADPADFGALRRSQAGPAG